MPADKPSEFGGKVQTNTLQPKRPPSGGTEREPDAWEKLRQVYRAGTEDVEAPVKPESFLGE